MDKIDKWLSVSAFFFCFAGIITSGFFSSKIWKNETLGITLVAFSIVGALISYGILLVRVRKRLNREDMENGG